MVQITGVLSDSLDNAVANAKIRVTPVTNGNSLWGLSCSVQTDLSGSYDLIETRLPTL